MAGIALSASQAQFANAVGAYPIARARQWRGVKFGRKPKLTPEQVVLALRMVDEGQPVPQVADAFGVHETTIYRCLSAAEAAV